MGCYGLGLNRIMAALVEQHHDSKGIQWPALVAPYLVQLITVNQADQAAASVAGDIYQVLEKEGYSCLYDDRDERAGVKFNDADLIGVPLQVIISDRNLSKGQVEIKIRKSLESRLVTRERLASEVRSILASLTATL